MGYNTHQYISRADRYRKKEISFQSGARIKLSSGLILRKDTHVKIPPGLFSIVTTAELTFSSSIFFDAVKTVSVGATVATLRNCESANKLYCDSN